MNPHKILGGLPKSNTYTHRCIGFVSFLGKKSLFKLKEGDYNIVHKALRRINAGCEQAKYCVKTKEREDYHLQGRNANGFLKAEMYTQSKAKHQVYTVGPVKFIMKLLFQPLHYFLCV